MGWTILDTGVNSAEDNMLFDRTLLHDAESYKEPVLHFYEWKNPSATYGHFIDPEKFFCMESLTIDIAKRPTGGGIIFHTNDLAFTVLIPKHHPAYLLNTLERYSYINRTIAEALHSFTAGSPQLLYTDPKTKSSLTQHFCMAQPTIYDIMLNGKKIGGAAQRRTKFGFIHQCSINLMPTPLDLVRSTIKNSDCIIEAISLNSLGLFDFDIEYKQFVKKRNQLKNLILNKFENIGDTNL